MSNPVTITADRLSAMLAEVSGQSIDVCKDFVKVFFDEAIDDISAKGVLTIKGLGTFSVDKSVTPHTVFYVPDKATADAVNAPFAAFEAIPLEADEMTEETPEDVIEPVHEEAAPVEEKIVIEAESDEEEPEQEESAEQEFVIEETQAANEPFAVDEPEEPVVEEQVEEVIDKPVNEVNDEPAEMAVDEPEEPVHEEIKAPTHDYGPVRQEPAYQPENVYYAPAKTVSRCRSAVWATIMFVLGILLGLCCGYFFYHKINAFFHAPMGNNVTVVYANETDTVKVEPKATVQDTLKVTTIAADTANVKVLNVDSVTKKEENIEKKEAENKGNTAKKANERPARYDQVTQTVYLATLARRYYGCGDYWVYIYDANRKSANLRHPDRIAPGTSLRIPYKDELPLTGDSATDLLNARRHGLDIYARYK